MVKRLWVNVGWAVEQKRLTMEVSIGRGSFQPSCQPRILSLNSATDEGIANRLAVSFRLVSVC